MPKRKPAVNHPHKPIHHRIHHGLKAWFFGPKGFYWDHIDAIVTVISIFVTVSAMFIDVTKRGHIPLA